MAPELFRGRAASPRSDLYAVGVMLLLPALGPPSVSPPTRISSLIRLHRHSQCPTSAPSPTRSPIVSPRSSDVAWPRIPRDRFSSADELADDLRVVIQQLKRHRKPDPREPATGSTAFVQGSRDTFRITPPQQHGERLQEVIVEVNEGKNNERFLSVFSVCGPAEPSHFASSPWP